MDVVTSGDDFKYGVWRELPILAAGGQQFGSVGKEFRAATLVGLDVRDVVANDAVIALAERGECERVRCGTVEGEIDIAIGCEQFAQPVRNAAGPFVIAVGRRVVNVGVDQRLQGFRADSGVVIAGKMLHECSWCGKPTIFALCAVSSHYRCLFLLELQSDLVVGTDVNGDLAAIDKPTKQQFVSQCRADRARACRRPEVSGSALPAPAAGRAGALCPARWKATR